MANTILLKNVVEPYVRDWLSKEYSIELENQEIELPLITGGFHRFDIVSKDRTIVAGIKTSPLRNMTLGVSSGVIKSNFAELYFLSLSAAKRKFMILTNKGFYDFFIKKSSGRVARGIEIIYCPLPEEIQDQVNIVHEVCRKEIGKKEKK